MVAKSLNMMRFLTNQDHGTPEKEMDQEECETWKGTTGLKGQPTNAHRGEKTMQQEDSFALNRILKKNPTLRCRATAD